MHLRLAGQLTHEELEKNRDLNGLRTTMEHEQIKYENLLSAYHFEEQFLFY